VFRDQVDHSGPVKVSLADARRSAQKADAVGKVEKDLREALVPSKTARPS
jgi:hypothetical protein